MPEIRPIGVSGSIPSTNQLALGDIAINTYDGKAYIKKAVGITETIIEFGSGGGGGGGSQGPTGAQGATGTTGPTGPTGTQGATGTTGPTGPQGTTGTQGISGVTTFPYAGNAIITGSLTAGATSAGPTENTLTLGPAPAGGAGEGGQLGFNATGGTYTSASFIDLWQNKLRVLKGTNAGSTAEVANWDLQTLNMTLPGGAVIMPQRPAFRVTGSSGYNPTVNTVISGSSVGVDYNQGGYYNSSNGQFTCPVAGLYHVWYVGRTFAASLASVALYKNNGGTPLAFWESNANSGHFGVSAVVNLAVNDVITAKVTAGQVTFDGNDNWGAAYIG